MTLLPERQGYPAPPEVAASREAVKEAVFGGHWKTARPVEEFWLGDIRVLRVAPGGEKKGTMIHFHGGGYRTGMPEMDAPFAERLADATGLEMLIPAYRLAPEYPCPAAINDGFDMLEMAQAKKPLFLSGASAGGGIATAVSQLAVQHKIAIAGLALHSPWLDFRLTSASWQENGESDPLFPLSRAKPAAELYLQGMVADDHLASPLLAELGGLPPTFISVGSKESLRDDARFLSAKLSRSTLCEVDGMEHVAVCRDPGSVGALETFKAAVEFLQKQL